MEELFKKDDKRTFDELKSYYISRIAVYDNMAAENKIPEHLKHCTRENALFHLTVPQSFDEILVLGIYFARKENNMEILNDAIFTYNIFRREYERKWSKDCCGTNADHSKNFMDVLFALSNNDMEIVTHYFPLEKGLTDNGHRYAGSFSNLIISLLYKNEQWLEKSIADAEVFLKKKNGVIDDLTVNYIISLARQDEVKASEYLQQISKIYLKYGYIHNFRSKFFKLFSPYLHGLYNFSRMILTPEKHQKIQKPGQAFFWNNYSDFSIANNYNPGKPLIYFDGEYSFLNELYNKSKTCK